MYEVQAILDKKIDINTNKQLYLIKWKGYSQTESSWEPIEHLNNCLDLLEKFQQEYGKIKTTIIGKVYIPSSKGDKVEDKPASNLKPEPKSNKSIKIKKQTPKASKFQIRNQFEERFNSVSNLSKQSISEVPNKLVEQTPKKSVKITLDQQQIPPLSMNKQGSSRRKNSVSEISALHRRASMDRQFLKNSNFNIVKKNSANIKEIQEGVNSHHKRQMQRQKDQRQPKQFAPIILSNENPPKPVRKNSTRQVKQLSQQTKNNQKQSKNVPNPPVANPITIIDEQVQKIDIIGMRKNKNNTFQFFVQLNGERNWVPHEFVYQNHSKQLCRFYESNLALH